MTKTIMILAIAVAFVASSIITGTVVTAQNDTIIACVHTGQGKDLRIVDSADDCRKNETPLEWNIQGIQGEKGDTGSQGSKGDTGSQGPKGDKGDKGDPGTGSGGSIGTLQTQIVTKTCRNASTALVTCEVLCPSGTVLTGGYTAFSGTHISLPKDLGPNAAGNGWHGESRSSNFGGQFVDITPKAICGKVV